MLYGFVDAQKAEGFPVRLVCSVVGVSPSAYYAHKHTTTSKRPSVGSSQTPPTRPGKPIRVWRC